MLKKMSRYTKKHSFVSAFFKKNIPKKSITACNSLDLKKYIGIVKILQRFYYFSKCKCVEIPTWTYYYVPTNINL